MNRSFFVRLVLAAILIFGSQVDCLFADDFDATTQTVGPGANGVMTPVNQFLTPTGIQVPLTRIRPTAIALSPDGKILVTAGLTRELIQVDPTTGSITNRIPFPSDKAQPEVSLTDAILTTNQWAKMSCTGLAFSPDGSRIYLSNVNGDVKVFAVGRDKVISPLYSLALPSVKAFQRTNDIPSGIAVSQDGKRVFVAGNLSNRLFELDAGTGEILGQWNVGVAPFDVVLCKDKVYVSNWGGRRPDAGSRTGPAGARHAGACG